MTSVVAATSSRPTQRRRSAFSTMLPPKASKDAASSDGGVSAALCCVIARWRGGIVLSAATAGSHRCSFMLDVSLGVIENLYVSLSHVTLAKKRRAELA